MPTENAGSMNIDLEQLRRNEERLRQLNEQLQNTWTSNLSVNDSIPIGFYQMEVEIPDHSPEELDRLEIHEIGRERPVFREGDVVRKEVKITDIPRKKVRECGVAVFCKKNFK